MIAHHTGCRKGWAASPNRRCLACLVRAAFVLLLAAGLPPCPHCWLLLCPRQVRTLNFLTMMMRNFPAELEPHMQPVCAALFYLFRSAPDSIAVRRELLAATRYVLTGPQKSACFAGVLCDVLAEGVLLGSSMASMEALKPLAVRAQQHSSIHCTNTTQHRHSQPTRHPWRAALAQTHISAAHSHHKHMSKCMQLQQQRGL